MCVWFPRYCHIMVFSWIYLLIHKSFGYFAQTSGICFFGVPTLLQFMREGFMPLVELSFLILEEQYQLIIMLRRSKCWFRKQLTIIPMVVEPKVLANFLPYNFTIYFYFCGWVKKRYWIHVSFQIWSKYINGGMIFTLRLRAQPFITHKNITQNYIFVYHPTFISSYKM